MEHFNRKYILSTLLLAALLVPQLATAFWVQWNPETQLFLSNGHCRQPYQPAEPIVALPQVVKEGEAVVFKITKPRATYGAVRYQFRTKDGTANAEDYVPKAGAVTFNRHQTVKEVRVETRRDHRREGSETFALVLHSPRVNWTPDWPDARNWKTPYQDCPSKWYEKFDRLPRTRTINATIIDPTGTSYEDQKYGSGYSGRVSGE